MATAHPLGRHVPQTADKPEETEPNTMFNKVILIGRLGQNAEAKTAQNNKEYVILNIATQVSGPISLRCRIRSEMRTSQDASKRDGRPRDFRKQSYR